MKILIFNWRDIKNPESGGAEVVIHENAERLVKRGHELTIFTSRFSGSTETDTINGVSIVRRGNRYTVYKEAKKWYNVEGNGKFDIVIDGINTIPFFTHKFVKDTKRIMLIHQLAREFWMYGTKFPLSYIGRYYLENKWLKQYIGTPTIAMSESTKKDLVEIGFRPNTIEIISEGINFTPLKSVPKKEKVPTMVFCGRLKKTKKPEDAIKAFKIVKDKLPEARLWMIGDGEEAKKLKKLAKNLKLTDSITFFNKIPQKQRNELFSRTHVILVPAIREGWGLVVTEANACGTPAIGYNVPGLRDSIKNNKTGFLCNPNPKALAETVLSFFDQPNIIEHLSSSALQDSRNYTWDKSSQQLEKILRGVVNGNSIFNSK